jgi:hypothetical protein
MTATGVGRCSDHTLERGNQRKLDGEQVLLCLELMSRDELEVLTVDHRRYRCQRPRAAEE